MGLPGHLVVGLILSTVSPAIGNILWKEERQNTIGQARTFGGMNDRTRMFDECSQNSDSKEQEIMNTFVVVDNYGERRTKCRKESRIGELEGGATEPLINRARGYFRRNFRKRSTGGVERKKRNFRIGTGRWPNGVVSYKIQPGVFSKKSLKVIKDAMKEISDKTCITFKEQIFPPGETPLTYPGYLKKFVYIVESMNFSSVRECSSEVGMRGHVQGMKLHDPLCMKKYIVVHELLHTLGMDHEQSRRDRDQNVVIHLENVKALKSHNFKVMNTETRFPYDMSSIMEYGLKYFSKNGKETIEPKYHRLGFLAGASRALTFYDIKKITKQYCSGRCYFPRGYCLNEGFLDHKCNCYCPRGLKGPQCEFVDTDADCGGIIDISYSSGDYIKTPNYPGVYPLGKKCTWLVKTRSDKKIHVHFEDIDLPSSTSSRNCYHWIEVKAHLLGQMGKRMCGTSTNTGTISTPHGVQDRMMFIFDSTNIRSRYAGRGVKLHVESVIKRRLEFGPVEYNSVVYYGGVKNHLKKFLNDNGIT